MCSWLLICTHIATICSHVLTLLIFANGCSLCSYVSIFTHIADIAYSCWCSLILLILLESTYVYQYLLMFSYLLRLLIFAHICSWCSYVLMLLMFTNIYLYLLVWIDDRRFTSIHRYLLTLMPFTSPLWMLHNGCLDLWFLHTIANMYWYSLVSSIVRSYCTLRQVSGRVFV